MGSGEADCTPPSPRFECCIDAVCANQNRLVVKEMVDQILRTFALVGNLRAALSGCRLGRKSEGFLKSLQLSYVTVQL